MKHDKDVKDLKEVWTPKKKNYLELADSEAHVSQDHRNTSTRTLSNAAQSGSWSLSQLLF